jgi:hypothetical protein
MTQTEYENQNEETPTRKPIGSVTIETFHMWKSQQQVDGKPVEVRYYNLTLWGKTYGPYTTNPKYPDSPTLYTMDDDGNIKAASCFREPEQ